MRAHNSEFAAAVPADAADGPAIMRLKTQRTDCSSSNNEKSISESTEVGGIKMPRDIINKQYFTV